MDWSGAIETAVLMFSDQQLVTGISILVSGYSQLRCGLSTYHWQIVVYLAWFASLTHLTTLTALRQFFRRTPILAYWRVIFMGCTIGLLATALGPTGYVWQDYDLATPATGYEEATRTTYSGNVGIINGPNPFNWAFVLLAVLFLLVSYLSRTIYLFASTAAIAQRYLRTKPADLCKVIIVGLLLRRSRSWFWFPVASITMTIYVIFQGVFRNRRFHVLGGKSIYSDYRLPE
jgi:hypothetical protein